MNAPAGERHIYGMAPEIRCTLLALYVALVLPLPLMAPDGWRFPLWLALALGWFLVLAITSEQVILDGEGVRTTHPAWCRWLIRRGWDLPGGQVKDLTPVATSQGGRVFYVRTAGEGRSYLLPQRVQHFAEFLSTFSTYSGIPTNSVARITPPWTYQLLAVMSASMIVGELVSLAKMP